MTFTPEQVGLLRAPLDSAVVKKPTDKSGPKGDYIEAWHAINEANRIFGFDAWSYAIDLRQDALVEGKNGKGDLQWQAAYTCVGTLTVADVSRQDVGFGSGFARGIGDAIEGATKEAATDALKRCLRTFGNPFGLALYDKSRANVADSPKFSEVDQRIVDSIAVAQTVAGLAAFWKNNADAVKASANRDELVALKEAKKAALTLLETANA